MTLPTTPDRGPRLRLLQSIQHLHLRHPLVIALAALAVSTVAGLALAATAGADPATVVDALVDGTLGSPFAIGTSLNNAALLMLVAAGFTVAYRAVIYHCGIDETVTPEDTGHRYEHEYSLCHSDHHMDDFGIDRSVPEPEWDESVMPCGTQWYGGT